MYPEILQLSFLHTYGVLVAVAFLTALWLAGRLAREAGLNADAVTNLGIYCALAAIAGAKLMMFLVDHSVLRAAPGRDLFALHIAGGRRVLRRADGGAGGGGLVHAEDQAAGLEDGRRLRAGHRAGPRDRPHRLLLGGLLLGRGVPPSVGGDVYQSGGARTGGCAAECPASSDTALRSLRGVRDLRIALLADSQTARRRGASSGRI